MVAELVEEKKNAGGHAHGMAAWRDGRHGYVTRSGFWVPPAAARSSKPRYPRFREPRFGGVLFPDRRGLLFAALSCSAPGAGRPHALPASIARVVRGYVALRGGEQLWLLQSQRFPARDHRRGVGNVIEWYDFYIFGAWLRSWREVFRQDPPVAALLSTIALFTAGFLIRRWAFLLMLATGGPQVHVLITHRNGLGTG